eukprot:scaffold111954_cov16-Tisochrysis_lutea.AAC.1
MADVRDKEKAKVDAERLGNEKRWVWGRMTAHKVHGCKANLRPSSLLTWEYGELFNQKLNIGNHFLTCWKQITRVELFPCGSSWMHV